MSAWKDKDGPKALLVGILLIAVIIISVLAFVPLKPFEHDEHQMVTGTGTLSTLDLTVDADVCDVTIRFVELTGASVDVTLDISGRTGTLGGEPSIAFSVESSQDGDDLTVDILLDMGTGPTVGYDRSVLIIMVDAGLRTALNAEVKVGEISLRTDVPVVLDGGIVRTDVGAVRADLGTNTTIDGILELVSNVGAVELDSTSMQMEDGSEVRISTSVGSVRMDVVRPQVNGNASFHVNANTGSLNLDLIIEGDIGAEITSLAEVGEINTELVGFSGMPVNLISENHPELNNIYFYLQSNVGSIDISAEWSG